MYIYDELFNFFNITALNELSTFPDLLYFLVSVFVGVWITAFIIKAFFLMCTIPSRGFF